MLVEIPVIFLLVMQVDWHCTLYHICCRMWYLFLLPDYWLQTKNLCMFLVVGITCGSYPQVFHSKPFTKLKKAPTFCIVTSIVLVICKSLLICSTCVIQHYHSYTFVLDSNPHQTMHNRASHCNKLWQFKFVTEDILCWCMMDIPYSLDIMSSHEHLTPDVFKIKTTLPTR